MSASDPDSARSRILTLTGPSTLVRWAVLLIITSLLWLGNQALLALFVAGIAIVAFIAALFVLGLQRKKNPLLMLVSAELAIMFTILLIHFT